MPRRPRTEAAVVAEFARLSGRALRTAQLHAQKMSPEWLEFLRHRAADGVKATAASAAATEAEQREFSGAVDLASASAAQSSVEKARQIEAESYRTLVAIQKLKDEGIRTKDVNLVQLCKSEREAQRSWLDAKRAREHAEVANGVLVPAEQVNDLRRKFILPIRDLLVSMPQEIAGMVSAFDSSDVIRACNTWLKTRFEPQLRAAADALGKGGDGEL